MIRVIDLWKKYGENEVLKGLNLEVHDGEILVILGRSGVGKSVLLRQIIGIERPDQGLIEVHGVPVSHLGRNELQKSVKKMGMLFQGAALFDSMTIYENIAFALRQHGNPDTRKRYPESEVRQRVLEALQMVGLEGVENKMPSDMSGGMRKRAGLARLIVYRPSILLYDEPTTGLDPITAKQITDLIVKTQEQLKGTSIVVTHDMRSAYYMADRLALHQDGKITHVAEPDAFFKYDDPMIQYLKESMSAGGRKTA